MTVVTFNDYASTKFGKKFPQAFFDEYYTGLNVPSWENNNDHKTGVGILNTGVAAARAVGNEPIKVLYGTEPRMDFDTRFDEKKTYAGNDLVEAGFKGFSYFNPLDIGTDDHASNGVWGIKYVNLFGEAQNHDVLGVLATESVFSVHLKYDAKT